MFRLAKTHLSDDSAAREVIEIARKLWAVPSLQRFFDPARYHRAENEVELLSSAGDRMRMDRLVELGAGDDSEVWVLDYKSRTRSEISDSHRSQLERYRAAVGALYPKRRVRAALIFAHGELVEV